MTENKGDLISREALKEKLRQEVSGNKVGVFFAKRVFDLIDNAPTVEQEIYISGEALNPYLDGYKEGMKDYKQLVAKIEELEKELADVRGEEK